MGRVHNELNRGDLSSALKLALGATKGEGGIERYGETLDPILNLWGMPEWAFLRNERLSALTSQQPAVAAEFGIVGIGNPLNSNTIIVVETVSSTSGAIISLRLEVVAHTVIAATVVTAAGVGSLRDRRFLGPGRTHFVTGTDAAAPPFGATVEIRAPAAANHWVDFNVLPVVLKPGDDLVVVGATVNNTVAVNFGWRERQAYPGELGSV